jgi:hypothetical protein
VNSDLGKLIAIHSTSPVFLQRAMIVAALSFVFFLLTLIFYFIWQSFMDFVLSTGFLIVQIFTMIGWWMQKRNSVDIYYHGIAFGRRTLRWDEIEGVERQSDSSLAVTPTSGDAINLPASIHGLDRVEAFIRSRLS